MKLLVLGGTKFLGRAVVEAALAAGHELTLFNRGRTNPDLFAQVEHLRGDRDGGLDALRGRTWDAVVDPSGYLPRVVRDSAELLRDAVGHYVFVSSVSAYEEPLAPGFDESAPVRGDVDSEDVSQHYGELKAMCERVVHDVFGGRCAVVRAGLIVGPHDPTGRFTYWPLRLARGGAVLAPGDPERRVQFVDVRDLGAWMVELTARRTAGAFTATCPPLPMRELLEMCGAVAGSDAELVWVDERFLLDRGVGQWMELPLWIESSENGFLEADVSRALATGLTFRPLDDTVRDTLEWARADGATAALASGIDIGEAGMQPEREAELLAEWGRRRAA